MKNNKYIGAHVSISGGIENAPKNAVAIGAKAFALFTKNQRQWKSPPLKEENVKKFKELCSEHGFSPDYILPHDSYLINLGNPEKEGLDRSRTAFIDEVERCMTLDLKLLNFHPGSHKKMVTEEECLTTIAESLNITIDQTDNVILVIENTAGQGSQMGCTFEQIATIIDQVKDKSRVGVCLDTCHTFASGYDIRTEENWNNTMAEFERLIGIEFLKAMHINDSKSAFSSRVDRHHSLGQGNLGWETFSHIMKDPRTDNMPLVLETIDETIWAEEIAELYRLSERS